MEIYLDVLVVVNTYITWMILSLLESLTHFDIKRINLILASLLGGISSLLILIESQNTYITFLLIALKILAYILCSLIAFYGTSLMRKVLYSAYFIGLNILLGGAVNLISEHFNSSVFFVYNGTIYLYISVYLLITLTVVLYLIISVIERIAEYRAGRIRCYKVKIIYHNNEYILDGMADTGNSVHDVFTGKPVIVCKGIPLYNESSDFVRIIPYTTIAGEGMLYAVRPDSVIITDECMLSKSVDVLVAGIPDNPENIAVFNPIILK